METIGRVPGSGFKARRTVCDSARKLAVANIAAVIINIGFGAQYTNHHKKEPP